jgi:hypothetical protein
MYADGGGNGPVVRGQTGPGQPLVADLFPTGESGEWSDYVSTTATRTHQERTTFCRPHSAAVRNSAGELLLVRRIDDDNWELPGGRLEVGESVSEAVVREVAEESGITVGLIGFGGVYSDPSHVLVDPDGSIHQQLALCFPPFPQCPTRAANHVQTA